MKYQKEKFKKKYNYQITKFTIATHKVQDKYFISTAK